jgi:putative flavoprotein involved in K+ transport
MGHFLKRQGHRFVILDAADSIGSAWRYRWDSLTLFTPRRYSGLPGLPFPGDPEGYPDRDEVIGYLERYAETFELPIELSRPVRRLTGKDGRFVLEVDGRTITADQVVVATGPFQKPNVPEVASGGPRTSAALARARGAHAQTSLETQQCVGAKNPASHGICAGTRCVLARE